MRRLSEQRVTLRAQLAEQSSTLLDQHPRIKELRAQIGDLERQMRTEADRLARSLENDAKLASGKVDSLSAGLDQLKRQAASTNEQDVQLRALERDAKSQRDLLESYLAKYREATARDSIGAASPDARIISTRGGVEHAVLAEEAADRADRGVRDVRAVGGLRADRRIARRAAHAGRCAGPDAGASGAAGRRHAGERADPARDHERGEWGGGRARAAGRAERRGGRPRGRRRAARGDRGAGPRPRRQEDGGRRITVIGTLRNVGTTMAAITLARSLGQQERVVLVDLALGAPNLSIIASDPNAPGIAELVRGSASFGQIITRDRYSRVHLIMAGRDPVDAAAIMSSQRLSITLEALARSYDHVVIDAGAVTDAALERLANLAPRAVLVAGELDDPATLSARARLLNAGFADVTVLVGAPRGPGIGAAGTRVAA